MKDEYAAGREALAGKLDNKTDGPVVLATFPPFLHTSPELEVVEEDGRWHYVERETR